MAETEDFYFMVARICHELDRAMEWADGREIKRWDQLGAAQQHEIRRTVIFTESAPNLTPQMAHLAWCRVMESKGYTHGDTLDHEKKTHPELMAYALLPYKKRAKDAIFLAAVRALCADDEPEPRAEEIQ